MFFNLFLCLVILGWLTKKIWEARFHRRTGLPPEHLWKNPTPADIRRQIVELEDKISRIERLVRLQDDPAASASIWEGLIDWEDVVDPGFEREKALWFELNRQLSALIPKPSVPSPKFPPCPAMPGYRNSIREEEVRISQEIECLKRDHPFKYFLVRGGMPGFAGVRRELALRINPGLRRDRF